MNVSPNAKVPEWMLERWQALLSSLIELAAADAGGILRAGAGEAKVLCSVGNDDLRRERAFPAHPGAFPAEVLKRATVVEILGAVQSSPPLDSFGGDQSTISYLGMPIFWPDGSAFGVIDIYSRKAIRYSDAHRRLMIQFRDCIEEHLILIWEYAAGHGGLSALARRSDEALRVSEERFRLLVENALDDFFLHDDKGRFLDVNQRACKSLGYSREELLQMSVIDVSTDLTQAEKETIWNRMQPGTAVTVYSHHRRKDGSTFPVEIRVSCHFINGQKLFLGLVRDITERVEAEQALQRLIAEREQKVAERTRQLRRTAGMLQAVMDDASDAIFLKDIEGRFLLFNRAAERISGHQACHVVGKTATDLFGDETGDKTRELEAWILESGEVSTNEETLPTAGGLRTFLVTRCPRRDEKGQIVGIIGISRDITDRKATETLLRSERDRLTLAAEVGGLGVWDYNIDTDTLYCDPRWYRIMGRDPAVPVTSLEDFKRQVHPDDAAHATSLELTALKELAAGNRQHGNIFRIVRPDRQIRWLRSTACLIAGEAGAPSRALGVIMDVTETPPQGGAGKSLAHAVIAR